MKWLTKIQESDRKTRLLWLIVFSAVAALVVLGIWLIQVRSIIKPYSDKATAQNEESTWSKFTASVSQAFSEIKSVSKETFGALKGLISETNEVIIEAEKQEQMTQ